MEKLKAKVVKILVKNGNNEADAVKLVDENIDDAMRVRSNPTPAKLAEIIICIS